MFKLIVTTASMCEIHNVEPLKLKPLSKQPIYNCGAAQSGCYSIFIHRWILKSACMTIQMKA